jgi:nitroreductase
MSFTELARRRYSCRSYKPDPIEKEKLDAVMEAGWVAPSACNYQPWKIVVIQNPENLQKIHEAYQRDWFRQAPAVLVICGDHLQSWKRKDGKDHCDVDVAIIADHLTLAATDQGLATCWICNFNRQKCVEILSLPENLEPIVMLSLGYPADETDPQRHDQLRKKKSEIIQWEL